MDTSSFFDYPTARVDNRDAASGFLDDADARDWDAILASMQTLSLRAGDTVFAEGQTDRALYLLTTGRIEISSTNVAPAITAAPPAQVLNEIAFLDGGRCAATARAITDGTLLRLSYDAFEALAAREPRLAWRIVLNLAGMVAQRLRTMPRARG